MAKQCLVAGVILLCAAAAHADHKTWDLASVGTSARLSNSKLPPPVDLRIPNIRQRTKVWCWAAVAQQVIRNKLGSSPRQCALVASAQGRRAEDCCPGRRGCVAEGTLAQIRGLIQRFGKRVTEVIAPTDAWSLYRLLRAGRPIILALRHRAGSGHVVVLTGLTWRRRHGSVEAVLHINDPIGAFPPRLPFRSVKRQWHAAIVVH